MVDLSLETPGKTFLRRLDIAKENKTTLLAFLYQTIQKANPSEDNKYISNKVDDLSDLDAMANYHGTLAELQINRNEEAIKRSQEQLRGMRNIGDNNFDYEAIMQRKIAVLSSLKLETEEYLHLGMQRYVKDKKYGTAKDFKRDFKRHINSMNFNNLNLMDNNMLAY